MIDRYDRDASAYRELWAPILRTAGVRLLRELSGIPARRILDVGTGVGSLLPELCEAFPGARVVGVDRSRGMLALAPSSFPLAIMDASRLGMASGSMDLVLLFFILFHLESPAEGVREARRVLADEGHLATITWANEIESPATRIWNQCLDAYGAIPADPAAEARHDRVDTPEKMKELLTDAGFRSVRAWEEDLSVSIDLERLFRMRTSLGSLKPRFDSLAPETQRAFLADARRRLEKLAAEDFTAVGSVVHAVAGV